MSYYEKKCQHINAGISYRNNFLSQQTDIIESYQDTIALLLFEPILYGAET